MMSKEAHSHLDGYRRALESYNNTLSFCLKQKRDQEKRDKGSVTNNIPKPKVLSTTSETDLLSRQKSTQMISTKLYQALSKSLLCNCTLLYLCLDTCSEPERTPMTTTTIQSVTSPSHLRASVRFSLLVASSGMSTSGYPHNSHHQDTVVDRAGQIHSLEIFNSLPSDDLNYISMSPCPNNLCVTLFANQSGSQGYTLENFLLRCRHDQLQQTNITASTAQTLRELIRDKKLKDNYEKYIIATKLGNAAVLFHSSPWIKTWDVETVKFFIDHKSSNTLASWTPHIASTLTPDHLHLPSNDMYALGMMLLAIADITLEVFQSNPVALTKKMGRQYKNFVQRCFMAENAKIQGTIRECDIQDLCDDIKKVHDMAVIFSQGGERVHATWLDRADDSAVD